MLKTIVHDLGDFEELVLAAAKQDDLCVVNANAKATHCQGCFKCWLKNRGFCVYNDSFAHTGKLMGTSEQCVIISSLTFGGLSSSVKKFFDRSISTSLPFFTLFKGETHHIKRYKTQRNFVFCFYGNATQQEKECAEFYARRFCINGRNILQKVEFVNDLNDAKKFALTEAGKGTEK